MNKGKRYLGAPLFLLLAILYSPSVLAADREGYVELYEGEQLFLPDRGEIIIEDENIAKQGCDGNIEAMGEGETEVMVRYKIRVVKPGVQEQEKQNGIPEPTLDEPQEEKMTEGEEDYADQTQGSADEVLGQAILKNEERKNADAEMEKETVEITVPDFTSPEIILENLMNLSSNPGPVEPVVTVKDENLTADGPELFLEGSHTGKKEVIFTREIKEGEVRLYLEKITEDDIYTLTCRAADAFGNTAVKRWIFTVNQQGARFEYLREEYEIQKGLPPEIRVDNMDAVQVLSCSVNGENVPCVWKDGNILIPRENLKQGKNRISIIVQDTAGNISEMEPWDFVLESAAESQLSEENEIKMGRESPLGIIFLLFGCVLVFWEKKVWYNRKYTEKSVIIR